MLVIGLVPGSAVFLAYGVLFEHVPITVSGPAGAMVAAIARRVSLKRDSGHT